MKTLRELVIEKVRELKPAGAAEYFGVSQATVSRWVSKKNPADPPSRVAEKVFKEYMDKLKVESEKKDPVKVDSSKKNEFGLAASPATQEEIDRTKIRLGEGEKIISEEEFSALNSDLDEHKSDSPSRKAKDGAFSETATSFAQTESTKGVVTADEYAAMVLKYKAASRSDGGNHSVSGNLRPIHFESSEGQIKKNVMILLPSERQMSPAVAEGIYARLRDQNRHRLVRNQMYFIPDARNDLAKKFLESDCEWSFWVDSDMILPSGPGHADWFLKMTKAKKIQRRFAQLHAIDQMISRRKHLIGGVYTPRQYGAPVLSSGKFLDLKNGPQDRIEPVQWLAAGCMLVHRSVYEAISNGDKDYSSWFDLDRSLTKYGEDVAFCERAKNAGVQPYLDLSIICGHVGNFVFLPEHQTNNQTY